jgi:hypothetical protein
VIKPDLVKQFTYQILIIDSIIFEICMFVCYVIGLIYLVKSNFSITRMNGLDLLRIILVKNYEQKTINDQEEEDVIAIGVNQALIQET